MIDVDLTFDWPVAITARLQVHGFTALLGASGAGKTSLLKALAGLLPSRGTPWAGLPSAQRPVGYMPQDHALFPHLTVLGNAGFALKGRDRTQQAQRLLDELGIGHLAARRADGVSGGEAQRVALARALGRRPALLLLDEPASALDAPTRAGVLAWLMDTTAARGLPALAATHDPALAAGADWMALLHDGRIVQQGTPRALELAPASPAAAALLGFENVFAEDGRHYAIRAADIAIGPAGRPARILAVRPYRTGVQLRCALPGWAATVLAADAAPGAYAVGGSVGIVLPPEKLRLLSPTGVNCSDTLNLGRPTFMIEDGKAKPWKT